MVRILVVLKFQCFQFHLTDQFPYCGVIARKFTFLKFLQHEPIAAGIFNTSYSSATGVLQPWQEFLGNSPDVMSLFLQRVEGDWLMLAPKARKAWNLKDLDSWMHIHWNQALERDCFIFALRSGNLASGMRRVQRMFAAVCADCPTRIL